MKIIALAGAPCRPTLGPFTQPSLTAILTLSGVLLTDVAPSEHPRRFQLFDNNISLKFLLHLLMLLTLLVAMVPFPLLFLVAI